MTKKINGTVAKLKKSGRSYLLTDKQKAWLELNRNAPRTLLAQYLGVNRITVKNLLERESIDSKPRRKKSSTEKERAREKEEYSNTNARFILDYAISIFFPDWISFVFQPKKEEELATLYINQNWSKKAIRECIEEIKQNEGKDIARKLTRDNLADIGDDYFSSLKPNEEFSSLLAQWLEKYYPEEEVVERLADGEVYNPDTGEIEERDSSYYDGYPDYNIA